jgi:hypothetical protein
MMPPQEVVLNHVDLAYAGATPTESSASFQNHLFKSTIDGGVPAFHFCNVKGKFVMANSFLHDNYNDQTYFTGAQGSPILERKEEEASIYC